MEIKNITGREIFDSRGNPTVEAEVQLNNGKRYFAQAPSGASTGRDEALELRDGGERLLGKGVQGAVNNIKEKIAPALVGINPTEQKKIDRKMIELDGTQNKHSLGANAIVAVSVACAKAGADSQNIPPYKWIGKLASNDRFNPPMPLFNIVEGGAHSNNALDFQEFWVIPAGIEKYSKSLEMSVIFRQKLADMFSQNGQWGGASDEGALAPSGIFDTKQIFSLLVEIARKLNLEKKVKFGTDIASSGFFLNKFYRLPNERKTLTPEGMIGYVSALTKSYPVVAVEDPLADQDTGNWTNLLERFEKEVLVISDDNVVTDKEKIARIGKENATRGVIIKLNQVGTVSEALEAVNEAKELDLQVIVSHRSGETRDNFIADFAVGIGAQFIKTGAVYGVARTTKYNRLIQICEEIGDKFAENYLTK